MEAFRYFSTGFPSLFFQIFSLLRVNLKKLFSFLVNNVRVVEAD